MRALALTLTALLAGNAATAAPLGGCDPAVLQGNAYSQCLTEAERKSSEALGKTIAAAVNSIATRPGVFDTQRSRWRNNLIQTQEQWLRFRNAECQEVAPFEGQAASINVSKNRTAAFEAKTICTIRTNEARAADIAARYPAQ